MRISLQSRVLATFCGVLVLAVGSSFLLGYRWVVEHEISERLARDLELLDRLERAARARRAGRLTSLASEPRIRAVAGIDDRATVDFTADEVRRELKLAGLGLLQPTWEVAAWAGKGEATCHELLLERPVEERAGSMIASVDGEVLEVGVAPVLVAGKLRKYLAGAWPLDAAVLDEYSLAIGAQVELWSAAEPRRCLKRGRASPVTPARARTAEAPLAGSPDVVLRVVLDTESVAAPLARTFSALAGLSALALVPSFLAVAFLSRRFASPIADLRDTVRRLVEDPATTVRASVRGAPELQDLSASFNRLVDSLQERQAQLEASRRALERTNWATGHAQLNARLRGEQSLAQLGENLVSFLAGYLDGHVGAVYLGGDDGFDLVGSYAASGKGALPPRVVPGEGLLGQAAKEQRPVVVDGASGPLAIDCGFGVAPPRSLAIVPLVWNGATNGVLALGFLERLGPEKRQFLEQLAEPVAIQVESAKSRARLRELLEKTVRQAEALQAQNSAILAQQRVLDEANAQLRAANKHKSAFFASMTHELRTPLNAIIGHVSLTLSGGRGTIPEKQLANLVNADKAARTLLALINTLLDYSKIEAGELKVIVERFDVRDVVEEVLLLAKGMGARPGVEVVADVPGEVMVESDFTKMKQVLTNLVSNAVKVTEKGRVVVRVRPASDHIGIEVEDTGCGIPREKFGELFQAFRQLDGTIQKRIGGTGLGLAVTKSFCEALGIDIALDSEVGKGTTFRLCVPLDFAAPAPRPPQPAPGSAPAVVPAPSQPVSVTIAAARDGDAPSLGPALSPGASAVVLYSGTPETERQLEELLRGFPLRVARFRTAEEARAAATSELVWSIVVEPDRRGFELLSQLAASAATRDVPVAFYSALAAQARFDRVGCLTKPVEPEHLIDMLASVVRKRTGRVLVVDDDGATRDLFAEVLSRAGFEVSSARDGQEAARLIDGEAPPDAVVLDLLMPGLDGFEVLARIRRNAGWARTPVVVVSGKDLDEAECERLRAGTDLLLAKGSFHPAILPRAIEPILAAVTQGTLRSILVVDDEVMNRDVLTQIFMEAGYLVRQASSGPEALEAAKAHPTDLVLMDLAMPDMDGFQTTRRLRAEPSGRESVIVACSAFALPEFRERAFEAGCEGYITKPVEPTTLVRQVKEIALAARIRRWVAARPRPVEETHGAHPGR